MGCSELGEVVLHTRKARSSGDTRQVCFNVLPFETGSRLVHFDLLVVCLGDALCLWMIAVRIHIVVENRPIEGVASRNDDTGDVPARLVEHIVERRREHDHEGAHSEDQQDHASERHNLDRNPPFLGLAVVFVVLCEVDYNQDSKERHEE